MAARRQKTAGLVSGTTMRAATLLLAPAALFAAMVGAPAVAATYLVNVEGPLDLGSVATDAGGDTVFRINSSTGAVTVQSGGGRRISSASARTQVTITCRPGRGNDNSCQSDNVSIRIATIGGLTGRARALSNFTVTTGTATLVGAPSGANPLAFTIAPIGNNGAKTFFVGADFPVAGDSSGLPTGLGENAFFVTVLDSNGLTLSSDTDKGRVQAFRALTLSKTADLSFGRIQIPTSGSSTISLDSGTGVRAITGTAFGYPTPAPTRAAFNITGEGGQQVSLNVPATFNLTGPSTLAVTVNDTAPNAPSLSGNLGAAGAFGFTVGGSFTITSATSTGAYAGVLVVSLDYN